MPSMVMAVFMTTKGRRFRMKWKKGSLRARASASSSPTESVIPAASSVWRLCSAVSGLASQVAATTCEMPASMMPWVQGGVRPQWLQGSRVT
ncbi:hypothetical protein D3C72_2033050 [compost metagenome]